MDHTDTPLETPVVDGEVIETEAATDTTIDSGDATVLLNLESLIKNTIASIEKEQEEARKYKEMFADGLNNDPTFKEHEAKVKEANKIKLATRAQILQQPSMKQLADKIRTANSEVKEKKDSLSEYLLEYQRLAGATTIEDNEGQVREIVNSARLIKQQSNKR